MTEVVNMEVFDGMHIKSDLEFNNLIVTLWIRSDWKVPPKNETKRLWCCL